MLTHPPQSLDSPKFKRRCYMIVFFPSNQQFGTAVSPNRNGDFFRFGVELEPYEYITRTPLSPQLSLAVAYIIYVENTAPSTFRTFYASP